MQGKQTVGVLRLGVLDPLRALARRRRTHWVPSFCNLLAMAQHSRDSSTAMDSACANILSGELSRSQVSRHSGENGVELFR